jgi:hypothetical protein
VKIAGLLNSMFNFSFCYCIVVVVCIFSVLAVACSGVLYSLLLCFVYCVLLGMCFEFV